MGTETNLVQLVRLKASEMGCVVFRNNVGKAYTIDTVKALIRAAMTLNLPSIKQSIKRLRIISFGLCVGSSDLIGLTKVRITSNMVGREVAVFTAIECKTKVGIASKDQIDFLDFVKKNGGFSSLITEISEFEDFINNVKKM